MRSHYSKLTIVRMIICPFSLEDEEEKRKHAHLSTFSILFQLHAELCRNDVSLAARRVSSSAIELHVSEES